MKKLLIILSAFVMVWGCDEDPPEVQPDLPNIEISVEHTWKGAELNLDQWYTTEEGDSFNPSTFIYHINNFELIDDQGGVHAFDDWRLFDLSNTENSMLMYADSAGLKISKLRFTVGVKDSGTNVNGELNQRFTDPMYWGMAMGYINVKLEGKTMMSGVSGNCYYHIGGYLGTTQTAREIELEFTTALQAALGKNTATLKVDLAEFFHSPNTISLSTMNDVQTTGADAVTISQNWDSMFSLD